MRLSIHTVKLFIFASNSTNDFDHISNESFPLYYTFYNISAGEPRERESLEWVGGWVCVQHIQNQTHFVEFVNNSAQLRRTVIFQWMLNLVRAHFHKRIVVCRAANVCASSDFKHQLLGFRMHVVLMKMKMKIILHPKYHANYFMTIGAIETTEQMFSLCVCVCVLLSKCYGHCMVSLARCMIRKRHWYNSTK